MKSAIQNAERYLQLLKILNIPIRTKDELMGTSLQDVLEAKKWIMRQSFQKHDKLIGIHPGGTYVEKQWGTKKLISLISLIRKMKNVKIILFTGKHEDAFNTPILNKFKEIPLIPDLSFTGLAALQKEMDLFIANDTGTLHSACGVGIPVIGIYMTTSADQWAPLNKQIVKLHSPDVKTVYTHAMTILKQKK